MLYTKTDDECFPPVTRAPRFAVFLELFERMPAILNSTNSRGDTVLHQIFGQEFSAAHGNRCLADFAQMFRHQLSLDDDDDKPDKVVTVEDLLKSSKGWNRCGMMAAVALHFGNHQLQNNRDELPLHTLFINIDPKQIKPEMVKLMMQRLCRTKGNLKQDVDVSRRRHHILRTEYMPAFTHPGAFRKLRATTSCTSLQARLSFTSAASL